MRPQSSIHESLAVVMKQPEQLELHRLALTPPTDEDIVVDIAFSGISTGTEKLLWSGRMPMFPGMGYPLVPGYESVGRVVQAGAAGRVREGDFVFVPGAACFGSVKGLFGGAASKLVVPEQRVVSIEPRLGEHGVLLALAATAHHVYGGHIMSQPDLIIGHGVLGRMMARLAVIAGHRPVVWESNVSRQSGAIGYDVVHPSEDSRRDYKRICDVSGDSKILDTLISRLAPGGEIALAGFYEDALSFVFPPAFMKEARLRVAAQWQPKDLEAVRDMAESGQLSLEGLITHRGLPTQAADAYRTAFSDPSCLKMILDWRDCT